MKKKKPPRKQTFTKAHCLKAQANKKARVLERKLSLFKEKGGRCPCGEPAVMLGCPANRPGETTAILNAPPARFEKKKKHLTPMCVRCINGKRMIAGRQHGLDRYHVGCRCHTCSSAHRTHATLDALKQRTSRLEREVFKPVVCLPSGEEPLLLCAENAVLNVH